MKLTLPTLPLSAIDTRNNPLLLYLWVQDYLTIVMGLLWITAYILYIRQAYRDASYGMPLFALCTNVAWELLYGLFYPPGVGEFVTFLPYFIVDLGLVYTNVKFGPNEWKDSPLIRNNIPWIILFGTGMMTWAQWAFVNMFDDLHEASFWSGFVCQLGVGWGAVAMVGARGSVRGQSLQIWFFRFTGTLCAIAVFQWRVYHYPADYTYVRTPMATFLFVAAEVAEVLYPLLFLYVRNLEHEEKRKKG
ncbi:hypothetical protein K458DRAFT_22138 [Lentithecium fluviatile CBS 122367]|uniref:Uncharacterized protein n=1 Tax=Lentithecium fluviatile CBS 122367 TaxID=1168545 RepID=A0A6G1J409_9PLEO|nr:hypothetical protein K458DRAFT_22138 [Lentithecium fluviatile CBS 122367]